jgi:hypothetical protein
MLLVAAIVGPTAPAYWFEALPAHGSKLVGTPTASDKFIAAQRLRSIPLQKPAFRQTPLSKNAASGF